MSVTDSLLSTEAEAAAEVERYLVSLIRPETRSYAARAGIAQRNVSALLAAVGNPHRALRVVHVTGSKGKGTTALLLERLLQTAGLRTATFTSPHLERWTERFRIDGTESTALALLAVFRRLDPHVQRMTAADADNGPSFFEVMTAAALLLFVDSDVDVAIIEVGLGGRYDATNVITPVVSIITGIELEHVDKLGPSLVDIARHKAGIIKPGVPVVCSRLPPIARMEIHAEAERLAAPLLALGRDFQLETTRSDDGLMTLELDIDGLRLQARTTLRASHLARNAALAVAAAIASGLVERGQLAAIVPDALSGVDIPGRVEVLGVKPWLVVDGAHTPESVRELVAALGATPAASRVLLLSMSGTKNAIAVLRPLLRGATRVVLTRAEPLRSREPQRVADEIGAAFAELPVECIAEPAEALARARELTPADGMLVATGSMYLAGLVRRLLREEAARRAAA